MEEEDVGLNIFGLPHYQMPLAEQQIAMVTKSI